MTNINTMKGNWWISGKEDIQIPGTLDSTSIELSLIGSFPDEIIRLGAPLTIHGQDHLGKPISIFGAFETSRETPLQNTGGISTIHGTEVAIGIHAEDSNRLLLDKLMFRPTDFDKWLWETPIKSRFKGRNLGLKYREPKQRTFSITPDLTIVFAYHYMNPISSGSDVRVRVAPFVELHRKEPTSISSLFRDAFHFSRFLALATMRPSFIENSTGIILKEAGFPQEVELHFLSDQFEVGGFVHPHLMHFFYKSYYRRVSKMLRRWFASRELLEPVMNLFFGNLYRKEYLGIRGFLEYVQALETLHSRIFNTKLSVPEEIEKDLNSIYSSYPENTTQWLRNRLSNVKIPSLAYRLEELITHNSHQVTARHGNVKAFIARVRDARNHYVHYNQGKQSKVARDSELHNLAITLGILLEGFLLEEIGFSVQEVQDIQRNRRKLPGIWY